MNGWEQVYQKWNSFQHLDASLKQQLEQLKNDPIALEDAFYKELTFGTGGMRGILGPGINRMNIYTIRKAVNGLALYLLESQVNVKDRGVVIAYDSRYMSQTFAIESAKVLNYYGIKAYVFESLRPTPLLSYAVRYLGTVAGIMITASHNPQEYNGFKVYNEYGGQTTPDETNEIFAKIKEVNDELTVPFMELTDAEEKSLFQWVGNEVDNSYLERLQQISKMDPEEITKEKELSIVYTPLHGTGYSLVMKGLEQLKFSQIHVVEEQAKPDPAFRTVSSPNPEEHQAFTMAMKVGKQVNADILLGTDPDADRLGVAVRNKDGEYQVLTGNQLGSLLLDYILRHFNPVVCPSPRFLKTVVTTELGKAIADSYQVQTINTLTGFKFIGEKIRQFDSTGESFLFGFEESNGYLVSSFVRDKDAVQAAIISTEMAFYWKKQGKTLLDALEGLYEKHGYYLEGLSSLTIQGKEGEKKIVSMMERFRNEPIMEVAGLRVEVIENYLSSERYLVDEDKIEAIDLPKENMVKFLLEEKVWVCLRPSGTEPKLKYYYGVCGKTRSESEEKLSNLKQELDVMLQSYVEN